MLNRASLIKAFFVVLGITSSCYAQGIPNPEGEELKGLVDYILRGMHEELTQTLVDPYAQLIDGTSDQSLYSSLFRESRSTTFQLERQRETVMNKLWIAADSRAAVVIARTLSDDRKWRRLHTVFFTKNEKGDWRIRGWHTSGSDSVAAAR